MILQAAQGRQALATFHPADTAVFSQATGAKLAGIGCAPQIDANAGGPVRMLPVIPGPDNAVDAHRQDSAAAPEIDLPDEVKQALGLGSNWTSPAKRPSAASRRQPTSMRWSPAWMATSGGST